MFFEFRGGTPVKTQHAVKVRLSFHQEYDRISPDKQRKIPQWTKKRNRFKYKKRRRFQNIKDLSLRRSSDSLPLQIKLFLPHPIELNISLIFNLLLSEDKKRVIGPQTQIFNLLESGSPQTSHGKQLQPTNVHLLKRNYANMEG